MLPEERYCVDEYWMGNMDEAVTLWIRAVVHMVENGALARDDPLRVDACTGQKSFGVSITHGPRLAVCAECESSTLVDASLTLSRTPAESDGSPASNGALNGDDSPFSMR